MSNVPILRPHRLYRVVVHKKDTHHECNALQTSKSGLLVLEAKKQRASIEPAEETASAPPVSLLGFLSCPVAPLSKCVGRGETPNPEDEKILEISVSEHNNNNVH